MNSTIAIPQRSENLFSGQQKVSDRAATILKRGVRLVAKDVLNRWSSGKFDKTLERLLAVLSVIYLIGAAGLAGILIFKAFSP
jgi:hypothetical protein